MTVCQTHPELTGKYVISPIDGQRYCRKNGQFLRHLQSHGFAGYQDWYETQYPDRIAYCSCGSKCSFQSKTMSYYRSCGNRACTGKVTSKVKATFTEERWAEQREAYRAALAAKTAEEAQASALRRKQTNLAKYGAEHPWGSSAMRSRIADTIQAKYGAPNYSTTLVSPESSEKLTDKDWMYERHVVDQIPLWKIAQILNVSDRTVGIYLRQHGIDTQNFQRSLWEREIEQWAHSHGISVQSNVRTIIAPKEIDLYFPDHRVAVELCGLYWHSDRTERISKNYHAEKWSACQQRGIQLLTIFDDEWAHHRSIVLSKLEYVLHLSTARIYARNTVVDFNVPPHERKKFLDRYHIQGDGLGTICVGLRSRETGELVALCLFGRTPNVSGGFTLHRYATSVNVVGGFSKCLNAFIKHHTPHQIITFSDNRWSAGALYERVGFVCDKTLPPDYQYVRAGRRVHKFNFRHASLAKMLPNYNPSLSERDNCALHGIYRVWDCGKKRYVWMPQANN